MSEQRSARREVSNELSPASAGAGPLIQRDYWAVIAGTGDTPAEIMAVVAERFEMLAPADLVRFERREGTGGPLQVGDELDVHILVAGRSRVRVVHRSLTSLTLATLRGHPEAGRITFGSYLNARGDLVFHIRSRARSRSRTVFLGFLTTGDPMQVNTWTDFINRLAVVVGTGVSGAIRVEQRDVLEEPADRENTGEPTFLTAESGA